MNSSELLESAVAETGVTGASFAYWDGNVLHAAAAGVRNSVTRDPVTVDTVMHIGSITKVMTTVLLMQLVDDGAVRLEDLIIRHLPDFRLADRAALERITCEMLVNHRSGINCDWLPEYGPDQERIVDSIERCASLGQLYPPGQYASYCNMGTVVAGYLAQRLRGESWYTLVKKRIYEPLGMDHALVDPLEVPRFRCSVGDLMDWSGTGKLIQTKRPFLAPSFAPAGSTQMMTASNLITFARALLNGGRIVSADSAARMMQPTGEFASPRAQMGLGWKILSGGVLHHGGGGPGVASLLYAHPASGRAVALLTNCARGIALQPAVLDPILESWTGHRATKPKRLAAPIDPQRYVGTYANNLIRYHVFSHEGELRIRLGANGADQGNLYDVELALTGKLHSVGDDTFESDYATPGVPQDEFRFVEPDSAGRMRFLAFGYRLLKRES
jgi:CubicO group peptidase (beta-lactamase class C family)